MPDTDLVELNKRINSDEVPADMMTGLWEEWLWKTDAVEEIRVDLPYNRMHLIGLILARATFLHNRETNPPLCVKTCLKDSRASVIDKAVGDMTLNEYRDCIENLQFLWHDLMAVEDPLQLEKVLNHCFCRLGFFAHTVHPKAVLDDEGSIDLHTGSSLTTSGSDQQYVLSKQFLRKALAFFFVTYRHVHLALNCVHIENKALRCSLHKHLISSSIDKFYNISMHYDTCVASVLQYRHEFTGMYHSVSQVMYFNNPAYERRKQIAHEDILTGCHPIHTLPVFLQLYPDMPVVKEEDGMPSNFDVPGSFTVEDERSYFRNLPSDRREWAWIVFPGRIYLVSKCGRLFYSTNLAPLIHIFENLYDPFKQTQGDTSGQPEVL